MVTFFSPKITSNYTDISVKKAEEVREEEKKLSKVFLMGPNAGPVFSPPPPSCIFWFPGPAFFLFLGVDRKIEDGPSFSSPHRIFRGRGSMALSLE